MREREEHYIWSVLYTKGFITMKQFQKKELTPSVLDAIERFNKEYEIESKWDFDDHGFKLEELTSIKATFTLNIKRKE